MNKIGLFLSGILTIFGLLVYLMTRIINLVLPKIGYAAFQVAKGGQYNSGNYIIDFSLLRALTAGIVTIGVILSIVFYIAGLKEK